MANTPLTLLEEVEAFLDQTQMGESYFGKRAAGNSELVSRLRGGRRVWPETEAKIRSFMMLRRKVLNRGHANGRRNVQAGDDKKAGSAPSEASQ